MFGRFRSLVVLSLAFSPGCEAWVAPSRHVVQQHRAAPTPVGQLQPLGAPGAKSGGLRSTTAAPAETETAGSSSSSSSSSTLPPSASGESSKPQHQHQQLTQESIAKLRYRELLRELEARDLPATGTTSQLRTRLRQSVLPGVEDECVVGEDGMMDDCADQPSLDAISVQFVDQSDPDFDIKELEREIVDKSSVGHWKSAVRKLKKLSRRFRDHVIPESVYVAALDACMANRMQGARASEPARKIMEQMVEQGYAIPEQAGNYCIKNSLGYMGLDSTHQGFGGIDVALAMLAAMKQSMTPVQLETYERLVCALAKEGSFDDSLAMLRSVIVDSSETPTLDTFAQVAGACVANPEAKNEEKVLTVLAYAKAAGYELDSIASTEYGRSMLASGVIAAERIGNDALGFRLLTAASKAKGVAPDRGDGLVASSSSAAQRACTLIHKRAITKACEDRQWKLAVKVLELMLERSLRPSPWVWRNVVTCCAKAEKSRKATALLLDWNKLHDAGQAEKPPLSTFNTVMNACEVCNEQDLTLLVLDAMKKAHDTEGNLITFNIALKRLAKQGNYRACEGIIIGMLQADIEPSVVSYTTAIAACVSSEVKQPQLAAEWMRRMRARNVLPNVLTYNTALAACLDGSLESSALGSQIALQLLEDVDTQLEEDDDKFDEYTEVVPNSATKMIVRNLMKQLKENWKAGDIDKRVATKTIRGPLLRLVDFQKSEAAERARDRASRRKQKLDEDQAVSTGEDELDLEFSAATSSHRVAEV